MKWISVWGPWAQLLVMGIKDVENRGWSTDYRGPMAIYATKGGHTTAEAVVILADLQERGLITPEQASAVLDRIDDDRGHIIGIVDVVGCNPAEGHASQWAMEGWALEVANAREVTRVSMPKGPQGRMIELDEAVAAKLGHDSEKPSTATYALSWEDLVGRPAPREETNDEVKARQRSTYELRLPMVRPDELGDCVVEPYRKRSDGELPFDADTWAVRVTDKATSTVLYDSASLGEAGLFDDEDETGRDDARQHGEAWITAQYSAQAKATRLEQDRKIKGYARLDQVDAAELVMRAHQKKVAALIRECADDRATLRREAQSPEVMIVLEKGRFVVQAAPSLTDGTIGRRWWGAPGETPQP